MSHSWYAWPTVPIDIKAASTSIPLDPFLFTPFQGLLDDFNTTRMVQPTELTPKTDNSILAHQTRPTSSPSDLETCVICLESISERAIAVPCNHCSFDFICLASWIQDHASCPLCKATLTAIEYDWRSPDDYKSYRVREKPASKPSTSQSQNNARAWRHPPRRRSDYYRTRGPPRLQQQTLEISPDEAISRRRHIYRHQLYSLHVGTNRISRFKDFTPATFARSSDLQSRARNWIRRELQVFDFLSAPVSSPSDVGTAAVARRANNTEFILSYIISILKTVDIKSSTGQAEEMLAEFLGQDNARLFLHELEAWLRSPYNKLEDWDRKMQYREPEARGYGDGNLKIADEYVGGSERSSSRDTPVQSSYEPGEQHKYLMRRHYNPD